MGEGAANKAKNIAAQRSVEPALATTRIWNHAHNMEMVKLLPGEIYVSDGRELLGTVLGSCIAACIWDEEVGVGGMNHFMLPVDHTESDNDWRLIKNATSTRYGNHAMEYLINAISKLGGRKSALKVKIFGGGHVMPSLTDIGSRNIAFVCDYLAKEGLTLVSKDVGENFARRVEFFPDSGRARVKRLRVGRDDSVVKSEDSYHASLRDTPHDGDIELF